ncbi:MAG: hypothetical protein HY234_07495 [Acidobacteria bacterium]|nr:hypothetical protein [Acidobacteriota bacterium]MBI3662877.1 hypothetical protein [Acidobacteriota bacterium]
MLGPVDYGLWFLGASLDASVLVCAIRGRVFSRYFTLNLYMLAACVLSVGRFGIFWKYGFLSNEYRYFYFYSDALLTICMFFALMGLYSHVFQEMGVHRYLRVGALLLLALTSWFTYQVLLNSSVNLVSRTRFVVELSQNLYFVGLVLTYLLWGAVMKLRETRTQVIQLVSALGVYFSALAGNYALHNLAPGHSTLWTYLPQVLALWLPAAWAYTFAKVPEEARIATAQIAAMHENHR